MQLVVEESVNSLARLLNGEVVQMAHFMSSGSPFHSLIGAPMVLVQALDPEQDRRNEVRFGALEAGLQGVRSSAQD